MTPRSRPVSIACLAVTAALQGALSSAAEGEGWRSLASFSAIEVSVPVDVVVRPGPPAVRVEADAEVRRQLRITVGAGRLRIASEGSFTSRRRVRIEVHAPDLAEIRSQGAPSIDAQDVFQPRLRVDGDGAGSIDLRGLHGQRFELNGEGAGQVTASGNSTELRLTLHGSTRFDGAQLWSTHAHAELEGAASAQLACRDKLEVHLEGASALSYRGHPAITRSIDDAASLEAAGD